MWVNYSIFLINLKGDRLNLIIVCFRSKVGEWRALLLYPVALLQYLSEAGYYSSMKKMKICLLYGGRSGEHEVSLRSAASVLNNLDPDKFEPILIGIDKLGIWHLEQRGSFRSVPGQGEVLEIIKKKPAISPGARQRPVPGGGARGN
ncbi:D-alanine--D-alanine ligase [subsurface metagenome]